MAFSHPIIRFMFRLPLIVLFFSFFPTKPLADIRYSHIDTANRSPLYIDFFDFAGTGGEGVVELNVSHISLSKNPNNLNLSQIGFFLLPNWAGVHLRKVPCALHSNISKTVYTLDKLHGANYVDDVVFTDLHAGSYSLNYQNCLSDADDEDELRVSMYVRSAMYNNNVRGRCYLSASQVAASWVYSQFFICYLCLAVLWKYVLHKYSDYVNSIHSVMLLVVLLKALSLIFEVLYRFHILHTGCAQCAASILLIFMSGFLGGAPEWALLVLIGTGWSFFKPHLLFKEKLLVMSVIPIHAILEALKVFVDQSGPSEQVCSECTSILFRGQHALDVSIVLQYAGVYHLLAVMIATVFLFKFLRDCSSAHGKAAASLLSFWIFRHFFMIVGCYVTFGALVFFIVERFWGQYLWQVVLLRELGTFVLYVFVGYKFRPEKHKFKLYGIDEDVEKAAHNVLFQEFDHFEPLIAVLCS